MGLLKKRRTKKFSKTDVRRIFSHKRLVCDSCNKVKLNVRDDIESVTCGMCMQMLAGLEVPVDYVKSDKPRGWHFKELFEHNGEVYSKGVLLTDKKEIAKLRRLSIKKTAKLDKKVSAKKVNKKPTQKRKGKKNASTSS